MGLTGQEIVLLRLVDTLDQPHELVLDVAVVVGWPERVLGDGPSWGEDDKVRNCTP